MTPTELKDHAMNLTTEFLRLILALLVVLAIYLIFVGFAAALECRERPDRTTYWRYRIIDGDRCWFKGHRVLPKSDLHWPDEQKKPKPIKGDPVFNQIRAEETSLDGVTWYMARPFNEAQPIQPPLNLAVPDDPDIWPDLSEFERRFVGVQP